MTEKMTKQTARNILETIAYVAKMTRDVETSFSIAITAISISCDGDLEKMINLVESANKILHENSSVVAYEIDAMRRESSEVHCD